MICVIIPSLNPDKKLADYVEKIISSNITSVIVINDGSDSKYDEIFENINNIKGCTVIRHEINKGKGAALKTGYKYFLENFNRYRGVITADSDGQHDIEDILRISELIGIGENKKAVLGQRDLYNKNVPIRSRIGNASSALLFSLLYGCNIWDTQSGLRGFSADLIPLMIEIEGERYDYEMNVLSFLRINNINIIKIPIKTIYINNNKGSHYRTVYDTAKIFIRIVNSFFRHSALTLAFGILDISLFAICYYLLLTNAAPAARIFICSFAARICVLAISNIPARKNAPLNRISNKSNLVSYIIWTGQLIVSCLLVLKLFASAMLNIIFIKYITDLVICIVTYQIQKRSDFKKKTLKYQ